MKDKRMQKQSEVLVELEGKLKAIYSQESHVEVGEYLVEKWVEIRRLENRIEQIRHRRGEALVLCEELEIARYYSAKTTTDKRLYKEQQEETALLKSLEESPRLLEGKDRDIYLRAFSKMTSSDRLKQDFLTIIGEE